MDKVIVIMSTYNGEKYVGKQIESILGQQGVDVTLYVRDDGSKDSTTKIIGQIAEEHDNVILSEESNLGWERSFLKALKDCPNGDYYAFSDQDDIWFDDKLISGIEFIKQHSSADNEPLMYHCNKISVDEDLKPYPHQVRRTPQPLNRQNALIQEFAQGCSIILNNEARSLVTSYMPKEKLAHDFWCGLLCYLFGKVVYDDRPHFYHITHGANASGEGHIIRSWEGRLKKILGGDKVYYSPFRDLLEGYGNQLSSEDKKFISEVEHYKTNLKDKIKLLFSDKFIRDSFLGSLSLKSTILLNRL